jgi:PDZ domain
MALSNVARICFIALMGFLCAPGPLLPAQRAENSASADAETIAKLIQDLGDKNFKVREAAKRRLIELDQAEPAVRTAIASKDFEISRLAAEILDERQKRDIARTLGVIRQELERGQIDWAIERFVSWNGSESDASSWQLVLDFCWAIHGRAAKLHPVIFGTRRDVSSLPRLTKDLQGATFTSSPLKPANIKFHYGFIRANGLSASNGLMGVTVSNNGLEVAAGQSGSFFVVNGSMTGLKTTIHNCIIICDGDVRISSAILNSIVIARGKVYCPNAVGDSVIIASGGIFDDEAKRSPLNGGFISKANEAVPLNFVKWFTPADVGLEVSAVKDAVKVEKLHDGKLPIKSGLKIGELITAVDGAKIDSIESFRRLLRKGSVQDRCVLSIGRRETKRDVVLDFRAEERATERAKASEKK